LAPRLVGNDTADLVVVGGGFTGLWTALLAKERDPDRDVVLLERESIPSGASGQNAGYLLGSIVDWFEIVGFKGQEQELADLARENETDYRQALDRCSIDCDLEAVGWVVAATRRSQLAGLREAWEASEAVGMKGTLLGTDEVRAELHSPQLVGGLYQPEAVALINPGKLAWGLKRTCRHLGVRIFESTPAISIESVGAAVHVATPHGLVACAGAALATFAHPPLIKSLRKWQIPIYSHVLVTEPLTPAQLQSIGWRNRQGFVDRDAFYHYTRLTKDNRILWGYMDATLHRGRGVAAEFEQDIPVFSAMARQFALFYPQLRDIKFSHRWGGALGINSRLAPMFGRTRRGRVAYALAYMPGIGGSRIGAAVMLDLLAGKRSPYAQLQLVSGRGFHGRPSLRPYPPEPFSA
jgi:glycine/D-amino acid oxidase-like deaminating enzyme